MDTKVAARENDWSGNTGYYLDENGNRITVGVEDRKRFLEDAAQSGKKIEKIPTRRFIDRQDQEYTVPEDRLQDFFYEMAAKRDPSKNGQAQQDYAEVVDFQKGGDIMSLPMWREQEGDRQKMRESGWRRVGETSEDGSWSVKDFDNAARHALNHAEDWGVVRDPSTGKVDWGESALEIADRAWRGPVAASASVALGAGKMVGDAALSAMELPVRGLSWLVGKVSPDAEKAIDSGINAVNEFWRGGEKNAEDFIKEQILGEAITQGTRMGEDLVSFGVGAGETYGEMGVGLQEIGKLGRLAVPAAFGAQGAESTLEDEKVREKGDWTARGIALVKGVTDAFAGHVIGKVMHAFGVRGAEAQVKKTIGKAIAVAFGESVEAGVTMGAMEGVNQVARGIAGVEDQMVDENGNPVEDPSKAAGMREATWAERGERALSAMIHGTVMTLGLKSAELVPRLMYKGGMAKAVSYDVENIRKDYAPVVAKRARAASALQRAGLPLDTRVYHDVKGVSTNGEVEFKDGSTYYPAQPDRDVVETVNGRQVVRTIKGRGERIVVCDGTILDAEGNVRGKTAAGQKLERTVDTQTEAYARMTDPEAASGQMITVFDMETGRASDLPDNILDIAPKAYREYNKWLLRPGQEGADGMTHAPQLDAESLAFGEIVNRLRLGGDSMHAAQLALGDIKAGRKTCREAAELLRQAEAQMQGKELVSVRSENSADTPAEKGGGIIEPMQGAIKVDVKPGKNGELPKSVVDSAADICELGKMGEIKPEEVDLTQVDHQPGETGAADPAKDANGEHGPIVLRFNKETGHYEVVDGNKRITQEKQEGAKTVEAVVLHEEDGWTKDNAQAVKDVANITSGNMGAKDMVEAFGRLGMSEAQAIEKGLIGTDRMPAEGWNDASLKAAMESNRRKAARYIAEFGDAELKAAVTDLNLMDLYQIAKGINARSFGEGWRQVQRAAMYELANLGYSKRMRAIEMLEKMRDFAGKEVGYRDLMEVAKYYGEHYDELKAEGIEVNGMPGFELVRERMAKDELSRTPVVTPEGIVKTVDEVTSGQDRPVEMLPDGAVKVDEMDMPAPGLELKPDRGEGAAEGTFGCARFPDLKIRIADHTVEITGVTAEDLLDPRNMYDYAKIIGEKVDGMSENDVLKLPPGTEAAYDTLMKYYDSSIKESKQNEKQGRKVMKLLEKTGLAKGVVVDEAEFNRALSGMMGGEALVADGLTYGWTDGSVVYLNPKFFGTKAGLNTKVHEFGHLAWVKVKEVNPELYRRGMELAGQMKGALEDLRNTPGYENYTEEKLREELLVKMIGNKGEELLTNVPEGIVAKVKQWISEVWHSFGTQLGVADLDAEKVRDMTMEEIAEVVRDELLSGRKFGEMHVGNARGRIAAVKVDNAQRDAQAARDPGAAAKVYGREVKPANATENAVFGGTTVDAPDGQPMYSIFSAKHDLKQGKMIHDLVEKGVLDKKAAKVFEGKLGKLVTRLEKLIDEDVRRRFLLDVGEDFSKEGRPFSPWKPNSDPLYQLSLDFSTLCKKRILTQYVIERLELERAKAGDVDREGVMSAEHQMAIRDMLLEYQKQDKALQVACHLCYVEAARLKAPKQINKYLADPSKVVAKYFAKKNKEFDAGVKALQDELRVSGTVKVGGKTFKLGRIYESGTAKKNMTAADAKVLNAMSDLARASYKPSAEEQKIVDESKTLSKESYLTADNLRKLHDEHPEIFEAYTNYVRESTHSKSLETDVPYYYGDSKDAFGKGMLDTMNSQGTGFRHQSWSDFQMRHLLDTIVAVADLSVRGAKMHAYTKVENFVEIMGRTGVQINMSLIPTVDGRGFDPKEGMAYETAIRLREKFPNTAGTIAISMSDAHLAELLNNPNIDYVIPYHVSGLNKGLRKMVGIDRWKDATKDQHEKLIKSWDGKKYKNAEDKDGVPKLGEWLIKDMRPGRGYEAMEKSAERYVQLCNERGLVPKFAMVEGLLTGEPGHYKVANKNYWKLLIDHKMVNQKTGALIEQEAVRPEFKFGRDKKYKDGIDDIIDREVADFDPTQMERAFEYIHERIPELKTRANKLKREGAFDKLVAEMDAAEEKMRAKDGVPMPNRPVVGGDDAPMLSRPRVEFTAGRQRVANDENRGEQTPGMLEASRELATQPNTPMSQLGRLRKLSLPLSELEWLRQKLTGDRAPAHVARNLPGGAASARTRGGKLVIAADVFGDVDRTDYDRQKALLAGHGYFRNEDPSWCSVNVPAAIRAEKKRSEQQLAIQLENVAARRTSGAAAGGESAARGVFADELANVIMELDHVPQGTGLGHVRTIGEGLRRSMLNGAGGNEDVVRDEAAAFLDWAYGPGRTNAAMQNGETPIATRDLPLEELTSKMFGALLTMPDAVEQRAPRWSAEMRNAICSDARMLAAFRELSMHAVSEQAHERLMSLMAKSLNRDTEELIAKIEDDVEDPIKAKTWWGRFSEAVAVGFHDKMSPVAIRVNENMRIYRKEKKAAIKAARDPAVKAMLAAELARFEGSMGQMLDKMELARLAMERGTYNEGRRYFMRQVMLVNEATQRQGLTIEQMCQYLSSQRVIETQGRAASNGETPRQAQLTLDNLRSQLGPERWARMQEFAGKWWAIHEQEFLADPRLRKAFGDDYVNYLETKTHYVTTSRTWTTEQLAGIERQRTAARAAGVHGGDDVVDDMFLFGAHAGMSSGEGLITSRLKGSFAAKKNVMAATWEKVDRAENFLRRNEFIRTMRDVLVSAGVEGVQDVARSNVAFRETDRYGMLNYMEGGQKRTLVVPRQIADAFKADPKGFETYAKLHNMWRAAIIDYNPAYWNRNVARNSGSIEKNMPGAKESWVKTVLRPIGLGNVGDLCVQHLVRHLDKSGRVSSFLFGEHTIMGLVPKAKRMAKLVEDPSSWQQELWRADDAGDVDKVTQMRQDLADTLEMLKGNMLVPLRVQSSDHAGFVNDVLGKQGFRTIQRIQEEHDAKSGLRKGVDGLTWIFRRNQKQQSFEDNLAKITAYLHDRINYGNVRTVEQSGRKVAENVSIAQGERHGAAKGILQSTVATFFNMVEKGIVRNAKAHIERPGEMLAKDAKVVTGVAIAQMIYNGVMSAVMRKLFDDDEEKLKASKLGEAYEFVEACRRAHKNYSGYVRENFNCFPIWTSNTGKTSLVIGMPWNDEDKLLVPGAQYMADTIAEKMGLPVNASVADTVKRNSVGAITPDLALTGPAWSLIRDLPWAVFDNPDDYFTGRKLYDQLEYDMRWESWADAGKFGWSVARQLWNDMGGRAVMQFDRPGIEGQGEEPGFVDVALRKLPVLSPLIRSFVKVQNGDIDKYAKPLDEREKRMKNIAAAIRREAAKHSTPEEYWSRSDPDGFEAWMKTNRERYGLDFETESNIRCQMFEDWQKAGPEKVVKEVEKKIDVQQRATRQGVRYQDILD